MDVLKPFPARHFDKMSGGFGIMMDDVIAGVYANILTHISYHFLNKIFHRNESRDNNHWR
jgi:phosphatidylglycerophosphatase A